MPVHYTNKMTVFEKTMIYAAVTAIFTETKSWPLGPDEMHIIDGYELFRNDISKWVKNERPYGGPVVYSRIIFAGGYPYSCNIFLKQSAQQEY